MNENSYWQLTSKSVEVKITSANESQGGYKS